jgi:hypothetical protein
MRIHLDKLRVQITLAIVLLLGGCQTTEERLRAAAADDTQCQSYGIKPGEPEYAQCRTNLEISRAQGEY